MYNDLVKSLTEQYNGLEVELIYDDNEDDSTGKKRNRLLKKASGDYIVFIDADDEVANYYIKEILEAAKFDCDCMGIRGYMTTNNTSEIDWELSKDFPNDTITKNGKRMYLRKTNHIAPVKRELALQTMFPDIGNGEDKDYSDRLNPLLKTEYKIEAPDMYHYKYTTGNKKYLK